MNRRQDKGIAAPGFGELKRREITKEEEELKPNCR